MKEIQVGLLGFGTVGMGVVKLLSENEKLISDRLGAVLKLKYVADIDATKSRDPNLKPGVFTDDPYKVVCDPQIDIVIEMIGGLDAATDLILKAVDQGKQVVTANKALLATKGDVVFKAAMKKGTDLAFEAAVGGCIPIIKSIRESLAGNRIQSITGILNGTCNYILSEITRHADTFEKALQKAQAGGYAEADPALDVEGIDTAHKLAILTSIAYGMKIRYDDIYIEGISGITPLDIEFASQFGYVIKLLAISKNHGKLVEARVHPTMIPKDNLLSNVNGPLNAVSVSGDAVGDMVLYGHGAGMMPTAGAVIGDVIDMARNLLSGAKNRIPLLSYQQDKIKEIPIQPMDQISTHYYFRFSATDQPGVLSKISGILGEHGISLKSVHQKGRKTKGPVPIVMLTHKAEEAGVRKALERIGVLDIVGDRPVFIRIEDENEQD